MLEKADAHEFVNDKGQHFVAFAGTNRASDIAPDIANFGDAASEKYAAAAKLGELYRNSNVVFTGHSLGGGLAKTAAAVASVGRDGNGENARQATAIGFDAAPIGKLSGVLLDHHVDPAHLESETIQVINRYDPLNKTWGGKVDKYGNASQPEHNEVIVLAEGKGDFASPLVGHSLKSLESDVAPGKLTTALTVNGDLIDKAAFDRYGGARDATSNARDVVQTLDNARAPERHHAQEAHGR